MRPDAEGRLRAAAVDTTFELSARSVDLGRAQGAVPHVRRPAVYAPQPLATFGRLGQKLPRDRRRPDLPDAEHVQSSRPRLRGALHMHTARHPGARSARVPLPGSACTHGGGGLGPRHAQHGTAMGDRPLHEIQSALQWPERCWACTCPYINPGLEPDFAAVARRCALHALAPIKREVLPGADTAERGFVVQGLGRQLRRRRRTPPAPRALPTSST
jgi:hypothetical protein